MPPDKTHGDDRRKRGRNALEQANAAAYYRDKAAECLRLAESADPEGRTHWIEIANGWTELARHAERQSRT